MYNLPILQKFSISFLNNTDLLSSILDLHLWTEQGLYWPDKWDRPVYHLNSQQVSVLKPVFKLVIIKLSKQQEEKLDDSAAEQLNN